MQYLTSATVSKRRAEQRTSVVHANGSGIIYRHTGGERSLDMFDRALPFDLAERRVDVYRLAARRNPGQQDRHVMACLPSPVSTATSAPARIIPLHPGGRRFIGKVNGHRSISAAVAWRATGRNPADRRD